MPLGELMDDLKQPFEIEGQELTTSVSVGVAIYPEDGADFETLLKTLWKKMVGLLIINFL